MDCIDCNFNPSVWSGLKAGLPAIIFVAGITFILYCWILYIKWRLKKKNGV